ncbi:MAG: hypothetical protein PHF20_02140 [Halothiobacillaceae bacterium]|nr:hypothetical protein [Halothiobacillaceae bacterium]
MKTLIHAIALSTCCLLTTPLLADEQDATPPLVLERSGTITAVELTHSSIKIDGKVYIINSQTRVFLNTDGVPVALRSLEEVDLDKASVRYELDDKGQLSILSITPARQKTKENAPNAKP